MARLREKVASLAEKRVERVAIHEIPGFKSVAGCELYFLAGRSDWHTNPLKGRNGFVCELDPVSWENVYGKLEPFAERASDDGFQWLDGSYWGISIIISYVRGW